jgi:hypothetical protein
MWPLALMAQPLRAGTAGRARDHPHDGEALRNKGGSVLGAPVQPNDERTRDG